MEQVKWAGPKKQQAMQWMCCEPCQKLQRMLPAGENDPSGTRSFGF